MRQGPPRARPRRARAPDDSERSRARQPPEPRSTAPPHRVAPTVQWTRRGRDSGSRGPVWLPFLAGIAAGVTGALLCARARPAARPRRPAVPRLARGSGPAARRVRARHPRQRAAGPGRDARLAEPAQRAGAPRPGACRSSCRSARAATRCVPGGLLGVDRALPRLFGFTEYADFVSLVEGAGFRRDRAAAPARRDVTTSSPTTGGATSWSPCGCSTTRSRGWRTSAASPSCA